MDEKTIKEALQKGERVTLECKKAKAEVPKSVWATYSAFANTIGGLILLGVDEDLQEKDVSKRFQIIGVDEPSKIITDFWNTLNSDKVNENILVDSDVEVVNMDGAQIVCIHVPQAALTQMSQQFDALKKRWDENEATLVNAFKVLGYGKE